MAYCDAIPRLQVPSPDATAQADPRYGLLSAATLVEDMDPHAFHGVEYEAVCDPKVRLYEVHMDCPNPDQAAIKVGDRSRVTMTADPFAVYAVEQCLDARSSQQMQDDLRRRLLRGERHVMEAAVYHGLAGAAPSLRHSSTVVLNGGTAVDVPLAVGALEHRIALAGRTGTIHAPRYMAAVMDDRRLLHRQGPTLRTQLGTSVAFGSGYTGQPPAGVADDGNTWLYVTGPVTVRRSGVLEPARLDGGGFDMRTNTPFVLAERVYVVDWPCGVAAIPTTIPRLDIGFDPASLTPTPPEPEPAP
ncbi:hypothetical protein [Nocardiopsis synnemataformans]|uniref:hypothetical protein n=1 Tax=Nocardiopsis synnemataformans TaxID=61305 RepID=UPI003EBDE006